MCVENFKCDYVLRKGYANLHLLANSNEENAAQKIWNYWLKEQP